jgi:sigma-B regulation protein RsbU (phosphoserine phosphatase)
MIRLRVQVFSRDPFTVTFQKPVITLGRSTRNDVCLEDILISRQHAEIREEHGVYWLADVGSANGTFLNGERLQAPARIQVGDVIRMGRSLVVIEAVAPAADAPQEPLETSSFTTPTPVWAEPSGGGSAFEDSALTHLIRQVRSEARSRRRVERQQALLDLIRRVGQALVGHRSLNTFLQVIVHGVFEACPADRALLLLRRSDADDLECVAAYTRGTPAREVDRDVRLPRSVVEAVLRQGTPLLVPDLHVDPAFRDNVSVITRPVRSIAVVPVFVHDQPAGILYMDSTVGQRFLQEDIDLLMVMASILGIKVENDRLVEQRIENERIHYQLASARDIQFRLLPIRPPEVPGYEVTGVSVPCYEVGGDYFDFIGLPSGVVVIALGDVSGKGFDAALLMASLHASVRSQAYTTAPVAEKVRAVHRYLWECTPPNRFVTLFYGELDPQTHRLVYVNAGHLPPVLVRSDGSVESLEPAGPPLGLLGDAAYPEREVRLEPGDLLAIYSDGMAELPSPSGEELGTARVVELLRQNRHLRVTSLRDVLEAAIRDFRGTAQAADDLTFVLVQRLGLS